MAAPLHKIEYIVERGKIMSISLTCPEFIFRTIDVQAEDELEISIRIGNENTATILVLDGSNTTILKTSGNSGEHVFQYAVINTGTLLIKIYTEDQTIVVTEVLLCLRLRKQCELHRIRNLRAYIEHEGTPRQPINIFNAFARVTFRDKDNIKTVKNLRVLNTSRSSLSVPSSCSDPGVCDYWKSQVPGTNILSNQLSDFAINNAKIGDVTNITVKSNWLWSIPASSSPIGQDFLVAEIMNAASDPLVGVVESIDIFLLMNKIDFENPLSAANCTKYCSPDPSIAFAVTIAYDRDEVKRSLSKSFTLYKDLNEILNIEVPTSQTPTEIWDELTTYSNGFKGVPSNSNASWVAVTFYLDRANGKGLDQCTDPVVPAIYTANGEAAISVPKIRSEAVFQSKCDSTIELSTVQEGSGQNRIVSVKLPPTTSGSWTLSMLIGSSLQTSDIISWDANADDLKDALLSIPYIGQPYNIKVLGTHDTQYLIEFTGQLAKSIHPDFIANGENLQGAGSYSIRRIQTGTNNDIQIVRSISSTIDSDFTLSVLGQTTPEIRYDVSLAELTSILESLEVVGPGNVFVTGNASSRTVNYTGPWIIEFKGALSGTAIPNITCSTFGYLVTRQSTGGIGLNEKHEIRYRCSGGTYNLRFKDPQDETITDNLNNIPFDIDEVDLFNLLTTDIPWFTAIDLDVTLTQTNDLRVFVIEYIGNYAKQTIPLPSMDGSALIGGGIDVRTEVPGSGVAETTRMIIRKARGGSYKLRVNNETTTSIPYNSTPEGITAQLKQLPSLQYSDVVVENSNEVFIINTGRQAGNVTMAAIFQSTLLCDPLFLPAVPEPDYEYPLPDCDDQFDDYSLMYRGALFCDPGEPYPEEPIIPGVLTPQANISRQLIVKKDLVAADFGPSPTVRQIARLKNIPTASYAPYLKTVSGLKPVSYDMIVENQYSLVFIDNTITAIGRVSEAITKTQILPSRMIWPID